MNTQSIIIADLNANSSLTNSGIAYGKKFNTVFNAYEKKGGELATIIKALIQESANKPLDFAGLIAGFASKIDRTNWNNVSTFLRTTAKKDGFKISLTCDRDESNKKANLIKASFQKIDIIAAKELADKTKAAKTKQDAKDVKDHNEKIVSEHLASHGEMLSMPTTQKSIIALFEKLIERSTSETKQVLFVKIAKTLEAEKAPVKKVKAKKVKAKKAPVKKAEVKAETEVKTG